MENQEQLTSTAIDSDCMRCNSGGRVVSDLDTGAVLKYEVRHNEQLGRYLVAAQDIKAGDLVFRAEPLVSGLQPGCAPLCLGCYGPLPPVDDPEDLRCPTCGWLLCSEECIFSLRHQPECEATARSGVPVNIYDPTAHDPLYDCVILIRCLMLKTKDPEKWNALESMEALESTRRPKLQKRKAKALCALLTARFGLPASEKEMLRLLAVLEVNAYEVRMPTNNVQAVYPVASLPEHNCIPNTFRTFEKDLSLCVRATRDIPKGDHITVTYTDSLWPTPERRSHLFYSKHFLCVCERCTDPTEMGSFLSALRCKQKDGNGDNAFCQGAVLPENPLTPPAKNEEEYKQEIWHCRRCDYKVTGLIAREITRRAIDAVHELDDSDESGPQEYENLLIELQKHLYSSHSTIVDVKHTLLHLYSPQYCTKRKLKRKETLCREIIRVADKLFSGISSLKGTVYYELGMTILETIKRDDETDPSKESKLKEASDSFEMSLNHLQFIPDCQPEWCVAEQAHHKIHELQNKLQLKERK
ncbi:SET domain-containing protein SmydA-8-like [Neocloeon triangulifer]|uniref:SET domain-containing protein SmydA-8-like n=1 Tax=Neocloeon triangulifer TaxID=2078957 RepID=UPI00286F72CA|nr:SET domain-containing protein SmydA-8-like [Neocloeon triangulifer]